MNILHVESSKNWGGQEYRTVSEVRWLRKSGHGAWIACNPDSELMRRAPELCVSISLRRSLDPAALTRIKLLCRHLRVDALHVHSPKDAWICAPLQLTIGPVVVRSRQITNPVKPTWSRSVVYRRGCAHVIATARVIRESLIAQNGVAPARISVVGEGIDLETFNPHVDGSGFRAEFAVARDAVLFGLVAMIRGEKGHLPFLEAAAEVARTHPHVRFAIVGEGTGDRAHERRVRERARELFGPSETVFFTGYRADTPEVMAALDVLVVPSLAEAQSLVAPQAFATGRAVIASNVGGLPEIVSHEKNGLLVPPGDASALAAAMRRLSDNQTLRQRLAKAALSDAETHLSFDRKMEQTLAIYERVVAREHVPRRLGVWPARFVSLAGATAALILASISLKFAVSVAQRQPLTVAAVDAGEDDEETIVYDSAHQSDDEDDALLG